VDQTAPSQTNRRLTANAALLTPFTQTGAIDWTRMCAHARNLLDTGLSAVGVFGTTGEGASISAAERAPLYEAMDAAGVTPDRIIECAWGTAADDVGRQLGVAATAGCAAILLPPPSFYAVDEDDGLFRWFASVLESAGSAARDVIVYNIPSLTGVPLGIGLIGRLRRAFPEVIAGVKDSSGNWAVTSALLAEHRDLTIFVGDERHLARAVRGGATGAVSGVANVAPDLVIAAVGGQDSAPLSAMVDTICSFPIIPALKQIQTARSSDNGWSHLRPPLSPLNDAASAALTRGIDEALAPTRPAEVG